MLHDGFPPRLSAYPIPQDEARGAHHIERLLSDFTSYERRFEAAIALLQHSYRLSAQKNDTTTDLEARIRRDIIILEWSSIAADGGAMALYHISKLLEAIAELLGNRPKGVCPSLRSMIDYQEFKRLRKAFGTEFPNVDLIRHSVAHAAEIMSSPAKHDQNAFDGSVSGPGFKIGDSRGIVLNGIFGDHVVRTIGKKVLTYELNAKSLAIITKTRLAIWSVFAPPITN
jgi:hypothetical protein